jgi:hypothetical protein
VGDGLVTKGIVLGIAGVSAVGDFVSAAAARERRARDEGKSVTVRPNRDQDSAREMAFSE